MATVGRVQATWQNFIGAPGYSRFTFEAPATVADATAITGKVRTFFVALAGLLPNGLTIQVEQVVPIFDEQVGTLLTEISASATPAIVTGTASTVTTYAAGAGSMVGWKTSSIWMGRRVQGRTFLVPMVGVAENNGTLNQPSITTIASAADGLIQPSTPAFGVWAKHHVVGANGKPTQVDGSFFLATGHSVPDRTGILRSRRD